MLGRARLGHSALPKGLAGLVTSVGVVGSDGQASVTAPGLVTNTGARGAASTALHGRNKAKQEPEERPAARARAERPPPAAEATLRVRDSRTLGFGQPLLQPCAGLRVAAVKGCRAAVPPCSLHRDGASPEVVTTCSR